MRVTVRLFALMVFLMVALSACKEGDSVDAGGGTDVDIVPPYMPPDPSTYVCNPFDGSEQLGDRTQGILGKLFYTLPGETNYTRAVDYITYAHPVDEVSLFFNQLSIPTRPWDRGFVTRSGDVITTPQGDTLYEYFGINFKSQFTLAPGESSGLYQFAILSDDGAVLRMQDANGDWQEVVNNDGTHPTRMGCGTYPVDIQEGQYIPFEVDYYQGPRYHISLIIMWRPWNGDANDPECGRQGNSRYFDSTQNPPSPQAAYQGLLDRGWQVVSSDHYYLEKPEENPCNETAPVIEDYLVTDVQQTTISVSWSTDKAATTEVEWTNVGTGEVLTSKKKGFRFDHTMTISGLLPNTTYSVKGISSSSSGLSTETSPVLVRTKR
ncbi:MAG: hypothetical protein H6624_07515 [Bdellovibrionaceae bacterium]|nr:hypothetical protein [Bdellovibrionales bacterium]MCB9084177.1 hypothetical protein [Pseudobdellovibrionaceae bacterium]